MHDVLTVGGLMEQAAQRWKDTRGVGMTGKELELARAYFLDRRNSRQARRISEVLRERIRRVVVAAITKYWSRQYTRKDKKK